MVVRQRARTRARVSRTAPSPAQAARGGSRLVRPSPRRPSRRATASQNARSSPAWRRLLHPPLPGGPLPSSTRPLWLAGWPRSSTRSARVARRPPSARESFRQVRLNMRRAGVPMLLVTRRPAIRDEPIAPTADTILRKVGRVAGSDRSWMTAVGDEAGTKSQAFKRELHGGGLVPSRAPCGRRRSPTRTAATRTSSGRTTRSSAGAWAKLVRSKAGLHPPRGPITTGAPSCMAGGIPFAGGTPPWRATVGAGSPYDSAPRGDTSNCMVRSCRETVRPAGRCPRADLNHRHDDFQSSALPLSYSGQPFHRSEARL